MAKNSGGAINQHKRMAMGEGVTALKKGGKVKKPKGGKKAAKGKC